MEIFDLKPRKKAKIFVVEPCESFEGLKIPRIELQYFVDKFRNFDVEEINFEKEFTKTFEKGCLEKMYVSQKVGRHRLHSYRGVVVSNLAYSVPVEWFVKRAKEDFREYDYYVFLTKRQIVVSQELVDKVTDYARWVDISMLQTLGALGLDFLVVNLNFYHIFEEMLKKRIDIFKKVGNALYDVALNVNSYSTVEFTLYSWLLPQPFWSAFFDFNIYDERVPDFDFRVEPMVKIPTEYLKFFYYYPRKVFTDVESIGVIEEYMGVDFSELKGKPFQLVFKINDRSELGKVSEFLQVNRNNIWRVGVWADYELLKEELSKEDNIFKRQGLHFVVVDNLYLSEENVDVENVIAARTLDSLPNYTFIVDGDDSFLKDFMKDMLYRRGRVILKDRDEYAPAVIPEVCPYVLEKVFFKNKEAYTCPFKMGERERSWKDRFEKWEKFSMDYYCFGCKDWWKKWFWFE